jgi:TRAP-type C4-dicarboxylate transport system substrate-binding protein
MNSDVYNSIPEKYRGILDEEINSTVDARNKTVTKNEEEALAKIKAAGVEIIELTPEERAKFAEASKSMYSNIKTLSPGIYDTIRGIIDAGK